MSDQSSEAALDATEPSMEDILASIREIIAIDDENVEAPLAVIEAADVSDIGNVTNLLPHPVSETTSATPPETFEPDALMADTLQNEEIVPSPIEGANADDFDFESELSDMIDLEIPEPDLEADLDLSKMSDIAEDQDLTAKSAAVAAASAVAIGGAAKAASSISPDLDVTDIDNELSALLDTTLDVPEMAGSEMVGDAIASSDVMQDVDLADIDLMKDLDLSTPDFAAQPAGEAVDLMQDDTLDIDLANMLDEIDEGTLDIQADDVQADISVQSDHIGAVSDQELDSLLHGLDEDLTENVSADLAAQDANVEDANVEEAVIEDVVSEDTLTSVADGIGSEEDADLLLVKSLMADLVDDGNLPSEGHDDTDIGMDVSDDAIMEDEDFASIDMDGQAEAAQVLSDIPDVDDEDTSIMDDILDMAIADEEASSALDNGLDIPAIDTLDEVAALELENIAQNTDLQPEAFTELDLTSYEDFEIEDDTSSFLEDILSEDIAAGAAETGAAQTGAMSLSGIAAAARADANAIDGLAEAGTLGAGKLAAGAVIAGVAGAAMSKSVPDLTPLNAPELEDGILDELTSLPDVGSEDEVEKMLAHLLDDNAPSLHDDNHIGDNEVETSDLSVDIVDIDETELNEPEIVETTHAQDEPHQDVINELEILKENSDMPRAATTNVDVIMDDVTEEATSSVFAELNQVVEEKAVVAERGDRIGDLVMEALRPMLKDWLDANLKGIVERAVTKEVKRISSGK